MRSLGIGFSLFWQRTSDAFLFPLISAGLSLLVIAISTQSLAIDEVRPVQIHSSSGWSRLVDPPASTHHTGVLPAHSVPGPGVGISRVIATASTGQKEAMHHPFTTAIAEITPATLPELQWVARRSFKSGYLSLTPSPNFAGGFLDFEVRSLGPALFSSGSAKAQTLSPIENAAFDVSYRLDNRQSIGFEVGEECIARDVLVPFKLLVGNPVTGRGSYRTIDRVTNENSLLTWYGIFYQYTAQQWALAPSLVPFGRMTLGFTSAGPVAQGIGGLEYLAGDSYAIQAGTEFTYLNYSLEGTRRASVRDALTFGIIGRW